MSEQPTPAMTSRWAELEAFARAHRCAHCRDASRLEVRVNRDTPRLGEVWCPRCRSTSGFIGRGKSLTQQWWENPDSLPIATANRLADKHRAEVEQVAGGLPEELGRAVREKYLGVPLPVAAEKKE